MLRLSASAAAIDFALALAVAFPPAAVAFAQDSAQNPASESVAGVAPEPGQTKDPMSAAAANQKPADGMRVTRTGSNIVRVRRDDSLPLLDIDRTYIDRTGAATTPELLRTIPQLQLGR